MSKQAALRAILLILISALLAVSIAPTSLASSVSPSFASFDARAKKGAHLNVVFFGGSLTWGHGATDQQDYSYRGLMAKKFEQYYPDAHFHFYDASIGGVGSQLAAFRLERDVMARKPDLVFLDYAVNDGCYDPPDPDKLASYESIVRKVIKAKVPIELLLFGLKLDLPPNIPKRELDKKHKQIGAAYHAPVADTIPYLRQAVIDKRYTPDELWPMGPDTVHPGNPGYEIYTEAAWDTYRDSVRENVVCRVPAKMINADTYMTLNRARISKLGNLPAGWKLGMPNRDAISYNFVPSRWLDDVVIASRAKDNGTQPGPIAFNIRGKDLLLFGESTMASGKYLIRIDNADLRVADSHVLADHGNLRYIETVTTTLDPARDHLIELIPQLLPGQELRLESVCVAGGTAAVALTESHSPVAQVDPPAPAPVPAVKK